MACSGRTPALRHLAGAPARALRASHQRRWAAVHDVRFLATTQPRRDVLDRYRDRLDAKARAEGLAGLDQLRQAYADRIHDVRRRDAAPGPDPNPDAAAAGTTSAAAGAASTAAAAAVPPVPKATGAPPLSSILDLPRVQALPDRELEAVWRLRHAADARSLSAVVPAATYARMAAAGRAHPQFVMPVPHEGRGAEMHVLQWTFDAGGSSTVLFARLAEYKLRGEFATPHTTVTHYADLAAERGVVLMRGRTADDAGVTPDEARWLVMCLQRFYGAADGEERAGERRRLLEWFAAGDERFSVERLMEEAERFG